MFIESGGKIQRVRLFIQLQAQMLRVREESSQSIVWLTPEVEEMSREVLGKRKRYILGIGVGSKSSSSSPAFDAASPARDEEFLKLKG